MSHKQIYTQFEDKPIDIYALDPNFYRGSRSFTFENGDQYEGHYCAHRNGIVWREGTGTYKTREGQIYTGHWKDDKLAEDKETAAIYPSGVNFFGNIVKNKYNGDGMYVLENQMSLLCEFKENKPTGEITLIDTKGKEWQGMADECEALLIPKHVYFDNIPDDLGKGRSRKESSKASSIGQFSETSEVSRQSEGWEYMKELELKVFKKTKKTASDLKLKESQWYTNFIEFKSVFEAINTKIQQNGVGSLDETEANWYETYTNFKKKYCDIISAKKRNKRKLSEYKLSELFNSEDFKNSCPPISVFYSTPAECGNDGNTECN